MPQFPKQYEENMKALLTEEGFSSYAATFEHEYRQGLRVNTLKISPEDFLKRRSDLSLRPVPWCPEGFYFSGETSAFSKHPDYAAGLYYLQEPSAMAPAAILPIEKGDVVLDLCAAPGGKSTYLAAKLGKSGVLFSNDISPSRAKALLKNLELTGTTQAVVISEAPYALSRRFPELFDKILVDAPCSGEGMFHKEPAIMKNWEQYGNEYYAKLQREILESAWQMLKKGGMLLYSTCTFSPMEDEQMVMSFLEAHPDMSLRPIDKVGGMEDGHPEWTHQKDENLRMTARFWPQKLEGQGHFAALFYKSEEGSGQSAAAEKTVGDAAEEVKKQIETLTGEKDALAKQVEELTASATKAKEDAEAALKTATDEAKTTIDGLTKQVEELTAASDFANMDEAGLKDVVKKLTEPLKKIGLEIKKIVAE